MSNVVNDYKIITQDDNGNLLIGYFIIKDNKLLEKVCKILVQDRMNDFLLEDKFDSFLVREENDNFNVYVKRCKCVNNEEVSKVEVKGNKLIRRTNFKEEHIHTYYDECTYEFLYLNSFLIFSSLLGNIDINNYGSIAKNFVKYGIIKDLSFADTWKECSKSLLKEKDSFDMEFFKEIFNSGLFVEYVITDVIKFDDLKDKNVLKKLDVMLSEIAHNSEVLGTYNKGRHNVR